MSKKKLIARIVSITIGVVAYLGLTIGLPYSLRNQPNQLFNLDWWRYSLILTLALPIVVGTIAGLAKLVEIGWIDSKKV